MSTHLLTLPTRHLLDTRTPQQVQALIERNAGVVLARVDDDDAARRARLSSGRADLVLTLRWLGTLPSGHHVTIDAELQAPRGSGLAEAGFEPDLQAERRRAEAWLDVWTHGLQPLPQAPQAIASTAARVQVLEDWRAAEMALADVAQVQHDVLAAVRGGRSFSLSHKEGSSTLRFDGRGFLREDRGEWNETRRFGSDEAFLAHLRSFYAHDIGRQAAEPLRSEAEAWRLIARKLEPARGLVQAGRGGLQAGGAVRLVLAVLVCGLAGGLAYLKWHPRAEALRGAGSSALPRAGVPAPPPAVVQAPPRFDAERLRISRAPAASAVPMPPRPGTPGPAPSGPPSPAAAAQPRP